MPTTISPSLRHSRTRNVGSCRRSSFPIANQSSRSSCRRANASATDTPRRSATYGAMTWLVDLPKRRDVFAESQLAHSSFPERPGPHRAIFGNARAILTALTFVGVVGSDVPRACRRPCRGEGETSAQRIEWRIRRSSRRCSLRSPGGTQGRRDRWGRVQGSPR